MSLVSSLIGRKSVHEFTSVASMPTIGAPMGARFKRRNLQDPKRKSVKEDEDSSKKDDGLIPSDAEKVNATSGMTTDDEKAQDDGTPHNVAKQPTPPQEQMLDTSLALVAPDCTPNWNVPLCGASAPAAPISKRPTPPSQEVVVPPPPSEETAGPGPVSDTPMSMEGMLRMGRHATKSGTSNVHIPGITNISEDAPVAAPSGDSLMGRGTPMPAPDSSGRGSRSMLGRINFNG